VKGLKTKILGLGYAEYTVSDRWNTIMTYFKNLGLWPDYGHGPIEHMGCRIEILGLGHQKHEISVR
jgi:hypothetical protein